MKKLFTILFTVVTGMNIAISQGVAINNSGTIADASAMLDVSSTSKGLLSPRMTTVERNAILSPATGLQIFNTDCNIIEIYSGSCWISLGKSIKVPGPITCSGTTDFCANESRTLTIPSVTGATYYMWTVPAGASLNSGQGTTSVTVLFGNNSGSVCVVANNNCESSAATCIDLHINPIPSTPGNITGLTNVYPGDNGISYFIASIVGATLYNWTVPTGCVITSGIGTSNIMIRYPCNATSNNISVTASTNCGASPPSGLAITVNPVLSASAGPAVLGGTAIGGSPTASGGKAPYTYAWSPSANLSSTVATNPIALCSGSTTTYTVTVTDVNGCTASNAVVVTRNLVANAGSPQTGPGTIGGSPTATGGQIPYIYTWSPSSGLSSTTIANPYANSCATTTYSLTVTDGNGCTSTNSITVTRNIVASAGSSFSGPGTIGGSPTVTGGKSPYTYSWNTSSGLSSTTVANPYATSCATTTYTITVTDVNSCTASNSITVTRNIAASAGSNISYGDATCGAFMIGGSPTASGGGTPYNYSWSPATALSSTTDANPNANPSSTTTYIVTVTDVNACTATSSMSFTVGTTATFSYTGSQQTWTVPTGVNCITIDAFGAQGSNANGGKGGEAKGSLAVTPGQVLNIFVGSQTALFNGGGSGGNSNPGGDASDVRVGGTALSNRVIVAGGGGGYAIMYNGNYYYYAGGVGGGSTGGAGTNESNANGGGGGTQSAGGSAGSGSSTSGSAGSQGQGGSGGGWGGGGGGGYYGGGGGGWWNNGVPYYAGGGGGGSNYLGGVNSITNSQNIQSGNGQITIYY